MAEIKQVIKAELDPRKPVQEVMQVIEIMLHSNHGHEAAVLQGIAAGVTSIVESFAKKGDAANAESLRKPDRDKPDK